MDYRRNSTNPVAARLFRREHKSKLPENRQLDPYFGRRRGHPRYFEVVGDRVNPRSIENGSGSPPLPFETQEKR